ncbi:major facilitator superfamily MFS_1 [Bacillus methanolicus PB1]|uniref:Major facilitator superfamily MFS_1 n=1 Tax=Bacillus methanolicus PB1 TaxID=997296 RepID=I3DUX3_BACMT|nr:MFS transporter [Bacillus methanolicus]EIJ78044.1 major facilitator superfamily MFS_1 [Bacillus methanolicus PB1]
MAQAEFQFPKPSRFALHSRTFRIFMSGSLVTRVGDWIDLAALNWAVLQFTNSPLYLGLINGCRLVPAFLLSVPAGILADQHDRRRLLILIQIGMMLLTFCLGYIVQTQQPFWIFVFIVTLRSILSAMDPPIRNALVPNLVPHSSMTSAIAINTTVIHLSRIMGPAMAGALLSVTDIANLFYINAWGTLGVLFSLLMIRSGSFSNTNKKKKEKTTFREAANYVRSQPSVQSLLVLAIVPMVFGFPYTTMMPLFARDHLKLGPEGFGILLSVSSIGALIGTTLISLGKEIKGAGKWLVYSIIGLGFSLLLFIGTTNIYIAGIAMFLVGLTSQTYRTMSRITLQMLVPDQLRGRILSIALMDRGFIPLGAILIGAIATWAGTLWAGAMMGIGCIATTYLIVTRRRQIWQL